MLQRILRLYTSLLAYFNRHESQRALHATEWQAVVQVVSVLDEAALVSRQIQGGRHAFVAQAINDFATLHESVSAPTQEVRSLDPWDGEKTEVDVSKLQDMVRTLLSCFAEDMDKRDLGSAKSVPERVNFVLDCRFKSCCAAVCVNGGEDLQKQVSDDVKAQLRLFMGDVSSRSRVQSTSQSASTADVRGSRGGSGAEGAGGGSVAAGAELPLPKPVLSRMAKIRLAKSLKIARPDVPADESHQTRNDAGLREFAEYMREPAPPDDDPTFTVLEYWKPRAVDGLDKSGNVILPARWPHVGLVARLFAGIDTTSCQAERNFSALKLVVSDLRSSMSPAKVEQTVFLRLNRQLIPGLGNVLKGLDDLKERRKENVEASVAAKDAAAATPTAISLV